MGAGSMLLRSAPILLSAAGFALIYVAVPNCRVPFRHAIIGGIAAAIAFNIARSLFTKLVVGSSYTFIYGAFAAVPLFLLWIYLSWVIVLMGGILVHSLSAYQSIEQAAKPNALKALDILYLFWEQQKSGQPVREIDLLNNRHEVTAGLDSETWRRLRDIFMEERLIAQDDKGHYFLCRDLHSVTFWQLKELVNDEVPLNGDGLKTHLGWQDRAHKLLFQQRRDQRLSLDVELSELFAQ